MRLKHLLPLLLLFTAQISFAQSDTVRITTYNLLHYGRPQANRYTLKNTYLQPILASIRPTIICFNEIDTTIHGVLDTINTVMPYTMNHGAEHNTTHTDILDGLFWKTGKFRLLRDTIICNYVRDIVAYDLYYDDPLLGISHDTVKLKVITAHLKSSNAVADRTTRATETQQVAAYLATLHDTVNFVMLGDFNLYKSSEVAYQNLVNPADPLARLNDPANAPGNWDATASFAPVHTQSPRLVQLSDEGASGGLDSRFDFLLISDAIMNGSKGMKYIPNTYTTFGNDGLHFNKALTDAPAHPTLPASIIQALYSNSDHLPVYADFTFTPTAITLNAIGPVISLKERVTIANPFGAAIHYHVNKGNSTYSYQLISQQGASIQTGNLDLHKSALNVPEGLATGLYFLLLRDENGNSAIWKLMHD